MRSARRLTFVLLLASPAAIVASGACAEFAASSASPAGDAAAPEDALADGAVVPTDGPVASDGGPTSDGCAGVDATFCDDFDDPTHATTAPFGWSSVLADGGGVDLTDAALSPPKALHAAVTRSSGGIGYLKKDFPFPPHSAALDLDVRVVTRGGNGGNMKLASLELQTGGGPFDNVELQIQDGSNVRIVEHYDDGGVSSTSNPTDCMMLSVPTNVWTHVTLAFSGGTSPTATLIVDGKSCSRAMTFLAEIPPLIKSSITVGVAEQDTGGIDWSVDFDDVVFRAN